MANAIVVAPSPRNEPILAYAPGSAERRALRAELQRMASESLEIPARIGGERVTTGHTAQALMPHDHRHVLALWHRCGSGEVGRAIEAALAARRPWARLPWEARAAVFLKAADLLAGPWRQVLNAATMLGQSKTAFQAEIDAACELVDFWRFNVAYATEIYRHLKAARAVPEVIADPRTAAAHQLIGQPRYPIALPRFEERSAEIPESYAHVASLSAGRPGLHRLHDLVADL